MKKKNLHWIASDQGAANKQQTTESFFLSRCHLGEFLFSDCPDGWRCGSDQVYSLVKACSGHKMLTTLRLCHTGVVCFSMIESDCVCFDPAGFTVTPVSCWFTASVLLYDGKLSEKIMMWHNGGLQCNFLLIQHLFYLSCFPPATN